MAVGGVGNGASALDRFQQARDLAKKKLDGDDNRARLADLLKRKQAELGQGVVVDRPGPAARAAPAPTAAAAYAAPAALGAYGRSEAAGKADPKPRLGRYIDLTA